MVEKQTVLGRMAQADHAADLAAAADWCRKALAASAKADQLRAAGTVIDADRFDSLAKVALSKQISYENEARSAEPRSRRRSAWTGPPWPGCRTGRRR